jgi:hypothetical protein
MEGGKDARAAAAEVGKKDEGGRRSAGRMEPVRTLMETMSGSRRVEKKGHRFGGKYKGGGDFGFSSSGKQ